MKKLPKYGEPILMLGGPYHGKVLPYEGYICRVRTMDLPHSIAFRTYREYCLGVEVFFGMQLFYFYIDKEIPDHQMPALAASALTKTICGYRLELPRSH